MAILDATLSQFAFSPITAFRLPATTGIGEFEWQTVEPFHRIHAYGTGFTYSGIAPTGGTVTSIDLDWVDDTGTTGFIDATLRGLSVPLTSLINVGNPLAGQIAFWETVLGGDDEIRAPLAAGGQLFGDFTSVVSGAVDGIFRQGGNDEFFSAAPLSLGAVFVRGGEVAANALVGDALYVQGTVNGEFANYAEVAGGDDIFNVSAKSAFVVVGDVQWVEVLGTVYGGNDKVNSTVDFISGFGLGASAGLYIGDVELNLGTVFGGDDRITGSNFAFSMEVLVGDVRTSEIGGAVTGGDDTLLGRSGQEQIAGDVLIVKNNSQTTGGADVIRGGGDSDIIAGDVLQFSKTGPTLATASVIGGDDRLFGDIGDDWISGDVWDISEAAGSSLIIGGDDNIFGGDGDDQLYGDIGADISGFVTGNILIGGDDTLDGGLGDDLISGQGGKDTVSFKSVNLAVIVDLAARAATGQGHDILQSIENATGSSQDDRLMGSGRANILKGEDGNDILSGRSGADVLVGGVGRDKMNGGGGADVFDFNNVTESGTSKADRDIITGWDAADLIDLSGIDANDLIAGNQVFTVSTGAPSAGQLQLIATTDGYLVRINTDNDAALEMTIQVNTTLAVTAADFIL